MHTTYIQHAYNHLTIAVQLITHTSLLQLAYTTTYTSIIHSLAIAKKLIKRCNRALYLLHENKVNYSNHTSSVATLSYNSLATCLHRDFRVYTVIIQCSYSSHTTLLQSQRSCQYTKYTSLLQLASTRNTIKYHDHTNFLQPYTIAKRLITHLPTPQLFACIQCSYSIHTSSVATLSYNHLAIAKKLIKRYNRAFHLVKLPLTS